MDKMTPTDAVYGFASWLTCQERSLRIGAHYDAAPMADLVEQWRKANGLPDVSDAYPNNIKQP